MAEPAAFRRPAAGAELTPAIPALKGGKRSRTRERLLTAAARLFAEQGLDGASVNQIAAAAGVVNGTFYYHFCDKAALVDELGHAMAAGLVDEVFASAEGLQNGADRVAYSTQAFIRRATRARDWSILLANALQDMSAFRQSITSGIRRDVAIGVEQGLFTVTPSDALYSIMLAVVAGAIRTQLEGLAGDEAEVTAAEFLLLMLGVPHAAAREIALRNRVPAGRGEPPG